MHEYKTKEECSPTERVRGNQYKAGKSMSVTVTEIRSDLAKLGFLTKGKAVADSDSLMDSGAIDSLRLIEFVTHIETKYGVRVDQDDLVPENFDSIDGITKYIAERNGNGQS